MIIPVLYYILFAFVRGAIPLDCNDQDVDMLNYTGHYFVSKVSAAIPFIIWLALYIRRKLTKKTDSTLEYWSAVYIISFSVLCVFLEGM